MLSNKASQLLDIVRTSSKTPAVKITLWDPYPNEKGYVRSERVEVRNGCFHLYVSVEDLDFAITHEYQDGPFYENLDPELAEDALQAGRSPGYERFSDSVLTSQGSKNSHHAINHGFDAFDWLLFTGLCKLFFTIPNLEHHLCIGPDQPLTDAVQAELKPILDSLVDENCDCGTFSSDIAAVNPNEQ